MRNFALAVAVAAMLSAGTAGPASAAPVAAYHGAWDSAMVCGQASVNTGVWNILLKADGTAEVSLRMFKDGRPHAAWGGNVWGAPWLQNAPGSDVFTVSNATMGLTLTLSQDGSLVYTIPGYCDDGSAVVVFGHLG